jgi:NAD(P)-dependent dehydrogenase (short-subunit alcohol dehydrogenase family)
MELKDKVIVITGGASGIGAALARRFAQEGPKALAIVDRNGDGAAAVADEEAQPTASIFGMSRL